MGIGRVLTKYKNRTHGLAALCADLLRQTELRLDQGGANVTMTVAMTVAKVLPAPCDHERNREDEESVDEAADEVIGHHTCHAAPSAGGDVTHVYTGRPLAELRLGAGVREARHHQGGGDGVYGDEDLR